MIEPGPSAAAMRRNWRFSAPELLNGEALKLTTDSDRYALAMTFLELVTDDYPFREISNDYKMMVSVYDGMRPERPEALGILSQQNVNYLWSLLEAMWKQNPWEHLAIRFVEQYLAVLDSPTGPQTDRIPTAKMHSDPPNPRMERNDLPPPYPGASPGIPIFPPATPAAPPVL
jgi:hypothetical protein